MTTNDPYLYFHAFQRYLKGQCTIDFINISLKTIYHTVSSLDFKRVSLSPEHAILQLVEQINNSFEKNEFALGVFVDLSKVFDTVYHQILIRILRYCW